MPSVSSTTTPPDVPQSAPSPTSSSTPSASSAARTVPQSSAASTTQPAAQPAVRPSRLSAHARRAWRATRAWLTPAPAATTSAALIVLVGLVLMPWGHRSQMALAALINRPERV